MKLMKKTNFCLSTQLCRILLFLSSINVIFASTFNNNTAAATLVNKADTTYITTFETKKTDILSTNLIGSDALATSGTTLVFMNGFSSNVTLIAVPTKTQSSASSFITRKCNNVSKSKKDKPKITIYPSSSDLCFCACDNEVAKNNKRLLEMEHVCICKCEKVSVDASGLCEMNEFTSTTTSFETSTKSFTKTKTKTKTKSRSKTSSTVQTTAKTTTTSLVTAKSPVKATTKSTTTTLLTTKTTVKTTAKSTTTAVVVKTN